VYRFRTIDWSLRYTIISLIGMVLARAVVVFGGFGLTGLVAPRLFAMSKRDQCVIFGAGLIRGAITWAQALQMDGKDHRRVMVSTTLIVISVTLVVVGGLLPSLLRALGMAENAHHDEGEMAGLQEAQEVLSCRRQGSAMSRDDTSSVLSPHEIAELGPGCLSRQPSTRVADGDGEDGEEEARPLVAPLPTTSAPTVSDGQRGASATLPPAPPEWAGNGGVPSLSRQGPVLYGPVHRAWVLLDERYLKPVFGGGCSSVCVCFRLGACRVYLGRRRMCVYEGQSHHRSFQRTHVRTYTHTLNAKN
jgi:hypothetical protein